MKNFFVILTIGFTSLLNAQSRLTVKAADSLDFVLLLDGVQANSIPCLSITLDKLETRKMALSIEFADHPEYNFTQSIQLKKNISAFYEVELSRGQWKLGMKSESTISTTVRDLQAYSDSTGADTVVVAPAPSRCGNLAGSIQFEELLQSLSLLEFEGKKLEKMKEFLGIYCVHVEELRKMIALLSMEDRRLELLNTAAGHIEDPENLGEVEQDFLLEKNRAAASEIIRIRY